METGNLLYKIVLTFTLGNCYCFFSYLLCVSVALGGKLLHSVVLTGISKVELKLVGAEVELYLRRKTFYLKKIFQNLGFPFKLAYVKAKRFGVFKIKH